MFDKVCAFTGQHVDDRQFNHGVATGLLTHGGTSHIDQYLSSERRVVDAHIEFKTLVLSLSTYTFAHKMYAMTHIANSIH